MSFLGGLGQAIGLGNSGVYTAPGTGIANQMGTHPGQYQQMSQAQMNAYAQNTLTQTSPGHAFDPNKEEAFAIPMSRLVLMWQARFNDEWVHIHKIDEQFYRHAHDRLRRAEKFELYDYWVRLKEDL